MKVQVNKRLTKSPKRSEYAALSALLLELEDVGTSVDAARRTISNEFASKVDQRINAARVLANGRKAAGKDGSASSMHRCRICSVRATICSCLLC